MIKTTFTAPDCSELEARVDGAVSTTAAGASETAAGATPPGAAPPFVNAVRVVGRVSAGATVRVLPSGDELTAWRVAVPRPQEPDQPRRVDTFLCVSFDAHVGQAAMAWSAGDVVDVTGAMRSRFWRGPDGLRSRYELDVRLANRVSDIPDP